MKKSEIKARMALLSKNLEDNPFNSVARLEWHSLQYELYLKKNKKKPVLKFEGDMETLHHFFRD